MDHPLLYYHHNITHIYLLIYVDNILITSTNSTIVLDLLHNLQHHLSIMKLKLISTYLSINIFSSFNGMILTKLQYSQKFLIKAMM